MYFGGTIILRGAASYIKVENPSSKDSGDFFALILQYCFCSDSETRSNSPKPSRGLSCPGVADMQTPLKSANMLQAIMSI